MGAWDVLMLVVATLDRQQWLDPGFTLDGVVVLEVAWTWDLTDGPASGVDATVADPEWMGGEAWAR